MKKPLKIVLITICSLLLFSVITAALTVAFVVSEESYVSLDYDKLTTVNCTLTILDKCGQPIDEPLELENTKVIAVSSLNDYTINCFVSIEDKRFFSHGGIDIRSIFRALLKNLSKGSFSQGASTITQQLVKNTHLSNEKNIKRKINEVLLSLQVEKSFSKEEILQMYLNTIYFGGNCYGIESASNAYFGKSASQLTLSESAYLAGMIKAPNNYSPYGHFEEGIKRRNVVLKTLVDNGFIAQEEFETAVNEEIRIQSARQAKGLHHGYAFAAIAEACEILNMRPLQLLNSSLVIQTYCDPKAQEIVKQSVLQDSSLCVSGDQPQKSAILIDNANAGVAAYYSVSPYDVLRQGRQIGSAAKPIAVYAPALELNYISQLSPVLDEKISYGGYAPSNNNGNYYGWVTAKEALSRSLNASAVKIINGIGADKARKFLSLNGIATQKEDENLTLALGCIQKGTDIQRLANSYLTLASGGIYRQGGFIQSISNEKSVIYSHKNAQREVFSEDTSYIITDMLLDAVKSGTGRKLSSLPFEVAAKTGTVGGSGDNSDALICGYTSSHTFAVWLSENNSKLKDITGGGAPAEIACSILKSIYKNASPTSFTPPQNIVKVAVDKEVLTYKHKITAAEHDAQPQNIIYGYFSKNNLPKQEQKVFYELFADMGKDIVRLWTTEQTQPMTLIKITGEKEERLTESFTGQFFDYLSLNNKEKISYYLCEYIEDKDLTMSNKITLSFGGDGKNNNDYKDKENNNKGGFPHGLHEDNGNVNNKKKGANDKAKDKKGGNLKDILRNWNLR